METICFADVSRSNPVANRRVAMVEAHQRKEGWRFPKEPGYVRGLPPLTQLPCPWKECPFYQREACKEHLKLSFIIPSYPEGVLWHTDTSSAQAMRHLQD